MSNSTTAQLTLPFPRVVKNILRVYTELCGIEQWLKSYDYQQWDARPGEKQRLTSRLLRTYRELTSLEPPEGPRTLPVSELKELPEIVALEPFIHYHPETPTKALYEAVSNAVEALRKWTDEHHISFTSP